MGTGTFSIPPAPISESTAPKVGSSEIAKQLERSKIRNKVVTAITIKSQEYTLIEGVLNGRVNCLLITQIITPARAKKVIKRAARTLFFLPENAYVRNIRMTEMANASVSDDV